MLRRCSVTFLVLILSAAMLFSIGTQKTYSYEDEIYKRVDRLCRLAGVIGPSGISPISGSTLLISLERINPSSLSQENEKELQELKSIITNPEFVFSSSTFALDPNLTINAYLNVADYNKFDFSNKNEEVPQKDRREEQLLPYRKTTPLLLGSIELYYGDFIQLEGNLLVGNNSHHLYESSFGWLINSYGGGYNSLFTLKEGDLTGYPLDFPYKAGLSLGTGFFSFIMGRYPHRIGNGETGNLIVGDNFTYQEIMKASFQNNWITYDISVTRFDQMIPHATKDDYLTFSRQEMSGDQQFRVIHQLDINIINKIRLAINLGTIYNGSYGFDPRFFYPFMIQHNYGNYTNDIEKTYFDEANNIMGLNIDAAISNGVSLHLQFVLDQFQTAAEDPESVPSAYGMMATLKYTADVPNGVINGYFEGVYSNPYLYLNGKIYKDTDKRDFNLDYIVGYHSEYIDDIGYSGYIYGPDSIVIATGVTFTSDDSKWEAGGNLLYRLQGENTYKLKAFGWHDTAFDLSDSYFTNEDGRKKEKTPTGGWDKAEHMIELKLGLSYTFSNNIKLYAASFLALYLNYNNNPEDDFIFKPMGTFGLSWSI